MDLGKLAELANHRACKVLLPDGTKCGAEFHSTAEVPALVPFSEHMKVHQFTIEKWTEAYEKIQSNKERERVTHRHEHKCRKCGRKWACNLNAGTKENPWCHYDNDPDCVKCEEA